MLLVVGSERSGSRSGGLVPDLGLIPFPSRFAETEPTIELAARPEETPRACAAINPATRVASTRVPGVSEGGLEPPRPIKGTSTSS